MNDRTNEDPEVTRWQQGTARFAEFWEDVGSALQSEWVGKNGKKNYDQKRLGDLQAVYLGAKPCMADEHEAFPSAVLEKTGLRKQGILIFDPTLTQQKIESHPDIYNPKFSWEKHLELVAQEWSGTQAPKFHTRAGLILGFPESAVRRFELAKKLCQNRMKVFSAIDHATAGEAMGGSVGFGSYGVNWCDYPVLGCSESQAMEAQLKRAFEESGMLDIEL